MTVKNKAQISQIPAKKISWFRTKLKNWTKNNLRDYRWRNTNEPYNILVAEFLLQRTDADTVEPIYQAFLICYPTLEKLVDANLEDIATILQPLGLFFRAERLWQTAQILKESHKGQIPSSEIRTTKTARGWYIYRQSNLFPSIFSASRSYGYQRRAHSRTLFRHQRRESQISL